MGSQFFATKPKNVTAPNLNMTARAINSGAYAGRAAAGNAAKDLESAQALYKKHAFKPQQRGAAYPPGPKI